MQKLYNELVKNKEDFQGSMPIVCPTTFNKPCRLCDLAKTILFKKDNEGTPLRQKASELNRKKSYYSNVIFPTNPSEIVVFQYGDKIWKELMLWSMGPASEIRDWLDPKVGRNAIVTKTTVAGNKRRTDYSTKSRINSTPLLDMSILGNLSRPEYQLDNILELIKGGKVKPFYQSLLQEGPNELRFLPSWLGPGVTKFFHMVLYHYGVSEEEFEMIQKGELNPFSGVDYGEKAQPESIPIQGAVPGKMQPDFQGGVEAVKSHSTTKAVWDQYLSEDVVKVGAPSKTDSPAAYPPCFGKKYDPNDSECIEDCEADGWAEACKTAFEAVQKTALDKRKIAKRLVR
jgi:hypothetical protein